MESKLNEWNLFAKIVFSHIAEYCIPQYGDYPDPLIEEMKVREIKAHIKRYAERIGKDMRGSVESERDCLKIAHYACYLYNKLKEKNNV